eukprot:4250800-Prorocentrum_lima.AAC.1
MERSSRSSSVSLWLCFLHLLHHWVMRSCRSSLPQCAAMGMSGMGSSGGASGCSVPGSSAM